MEVVHDASKNKIIRDNLNVDNNTTKTLCCTEKLLLAVFLTYILFITLDFHGEISIRLARMN